MIALSDNTATDAIIQILGREAIETLSERNRPFLTTREAFVLKNPDNQALLQQYRKGDTQKKRQVLLEAQSASLPDVALFEGNPIATDVEWFFSSRELCRLMEAVADLPFILTRGFGGAIRPTLYPIGSVWDTWTPPSE